MDLYYKLRISYPRWLEDIIFFELYNLGVPAFEEVEDGVVIWFDEEPKATLLIERLKSSVAIEQLNEVELSIEQVTFSDTETWRDFAEPVEISPLITIVPSWKDIDPSLVSPKPGRIFIYIDPETTFGAGTHPSTKLALRLIEESAQKIEKDAFLDVGCGSGILSIAASLLGFKTTIGVDIDPNCILVSQTNAIKNNVSCTFSIDPLSSIERKFPIIAANMLSSSLYQLWPEILDKTDYHSRIIVSGLLAEEEPDLKKFHGVEIVKEVLEDGWLGLEMIRR